MKSLGSRLEAVLSLLSAEENNNLFADIGSDHAFLAIEVLKRNIAKNAVASDINKMPLEKGRENAQSMGIDIEFILSDGFDALEEMPITSAAICGMGGELIAKILLRSNIAKKCSLILQPMSAQEDLRKALWDNGFNIKNEIFVTESGKPYTVILAKYDGITRKYDYCDLYLGKELKASKSFANYCQKIKSAAEKRRIGIISRNEETTEIDKLISLCQAQITSFSDGMYFCK